MTTNEILPEYLSRTSEPFVMYERVNDPMVSVTEHYTIIHELPEEERSPAVTDMIANNGVEAIANAMVLAKPYAGEVFTATWYDCDGERREITLKVLDRK